MLSCDLITKEGLTILAFPRPNPWFKGWSALVTPPSACSSLQPGVTISSVGYMTLLFIQPLILITFVTLKFLLPHLSFSARI